MDQHIGLSRMLNDELEIRGKIAGDEFHLLTPRHHRGTLSIAGHGDNGVPFAQETGDNMPADEAGRAGHYDLHGRTFSSGTATTNLPPHDLICSCCCRTSEEMFQGR